jgi:hypothetical protein
VPVAERGSSSSCRPDDDQIGDEVPMNPKQSIAITGSLTLAAAALLSMTGCGVKTGDGTYRAIPPQDIQFGLDDTTSTSSTTSTTLPLVPPTTIETTTTIALAEVQMYFLSRGRLQPVSLALATGYGNDQVTALLEKGPPDGAAGIGLETQIEKGLIRSAVAANGVITIDLDPEIFGRIPSFNQAEAIGQIVLTMTSNIPRVGLVLFTLGGVPTQVKKGDSLLSAPGEAVSFDDFKQLLASAPPPSTTTVPPG